MARSLPFLPRWRRGRLVLVFMVALVSGCKTGPDYQRPAVNAPPAWRSGAPESASLADADWWVFHSDPVLTNLIGIALANNLDLSIAAARVEEARAGYLAQRAALFPEAQASAGWSRARAGSLGMAPGATGSSFDVFGLLSYEVDFWGRMRRLSEAARAEWLSSEAAQRAVRLSLIGAVASAYFDLHAADEQLAIARRTLVSRTNYLNIVTIKYNEVDGRGQGIVSQLDVRQAETQIHSAAASVASLERAASLAENRLRLLLGSNPGPVERGVPLSQQPLPEALPAGVPSDLLLRRPDLLAAEQRLVAANASVGAARAAYFPAISLTSALGLQNAQLNDLFDPGVSRAWRLAPQVAAPVFNAGRIRAANRAAAARRDAASAEYRSAIQAAFREVEDALVSTIRLREQLQFELAAVAAERSRLELSQLRYEAGIASYSDVLDAERFLFSAELTAVRTRADLLATRAQLYKALGGGWDYKKASNQEFQQ